MLANTHCVIISAAEKLRQAVPLDNCKLYNCKESLKNI